MTTPHAFITGGGSGIGLGIARALIGVGSSVTLCGRTAEKLDEAKRELDGMLDGTAGDTAVEVTVEVAVADVADEDALAAAIDSANQRSALTTVIANAGVGSAGPFLGTELAQWQRVLDTNLTGAFLTFKHGGRALAANGGGSMCAVSSIAGSHTHRFMTAYTASKAGLNMVVRNAADELGALGIRVNGVAPGLVETDISQSLQDNADVDADYRINMPLGRHGTTDDIGAAVRFLCSEEASWVTGVIMPVDGGHHLRRGPNIDPLLAPFVPDLPPPTA